MFPVLLEAVLPSTEKPCTKAIGTHLYCRFHKDAEGRTYITYSVANDLKLSFPFSEIFCNPSSARLLLDYSCFSPLTPHNGWLSTLSFFPPEFHSKSQVSLLTSTQRGTSTLPVMLAHNCIFTLIMGSTKGPHINGTHHQQKVVDPPLLVT